VVGCALLAALASVSPAVSRPGNSVIETATSPVVPSCDSRPQRAILCAHHPTIGSLLRFDSAAISQSGVVVQRYADGEATRDEFDPNSKSAGSEP
jgi:hypothetical protein